MSVYTEVKRDELVAFLSKYAVGDLVSYTGISAGIENTNYFVTTDHGEFVLTLFEHHSFFELDYFLDLMAFYAEHKIPCAHPEADKEGSYLRTLCDRPAALVVRLSGRSVEALPNLNQCEAIGQVLGKMHIVGNRFAETRETTRGVAWREQAAQQLLPKLDKNRAKLLTDELTAQSTYATLALPTGVTHSDLFRDNALFEGDTLTGVIDFYYACDEYLLYDLAVVVNDWCIDEQGEIDMERYQILTKAYNEQRTITAAEKKAWNIMLRVAALRFWLSRLLDQHFPREGELTQQKNPDEFLAILKCHRSTNLDH